MTLAPPPVWSDAGLAAALFAIDPTGLGGVAVRAHSGPVRERWCETLRSLLPPESPVRRIPLNIGDDRLLGGLELAASLASGRPVAQRGVLAEADGGVAFLPMAERISDATAGRLAAVLDRGEVVMERDGLTLRLPARVGLVLLDEGLEPEERPPDALMERLAFHIDLRELGPRMLGEACIDAAAVQSARARWSTVAAPAPEVIEALCAAAQMFGVGSLRAPILALAAARAHAALQGRVSVSDEDAAIGARLVLGPRALTAPSNADEASPPPTPPEPEAEAEGADEAAAAPPIPDDAGPGEDGTAGLTDRVVEAVQAALAGDLLDQARSLSKGRTRAAPAPRARGEGSAAKSTRRGRPVGSRSGALRDGERLNLVETLRAAAPWQGLRRAPGGGAGPRVLVTRDDFRIRRFVQREQSTTIFVVDASGSAAFERLAEAKGAVELLLAKAYVSRSMVALIAFRDRRAEVLLPSTRSLTRAKRQLADLPGGGGTPLAAGMDAALTLGLAEKAKDRTPLLVFLTDGRANIARDGAAGRGAAEQDAMAAARLLGAAGLGAVFVDTSARAQPGGDRFAKAMGAVYAPLPYVEANALLGLIEGRAAAP